MARIDDDRQANSGSHANDTDGDARPAWQRERSKHGPACRKFATRAVRVRQTGQPPRRTQGPTPHAPRIRRMLLTGASN